jgi:WD40 repeat protein
VWTVALSPDGRTAYSGSFDGAVRVWDVAAGRCVATWMEEDEGERGWKRALVLTPDGGGAILGGQASPRHWDAAAGRLAAKFDGGHLESVLSLAMSADGRRIASGGFDGRIHLWDAASRCSVAGWDAAQGAGVWAVAFLPDGRLLSAGDTGTIRVWAPRAP